MYVNVQKSNVRRQTYRRRPSYDTRYYGRRLYLPYSNPAMSRSMSRSLGDDYDGLEGWWKNTFGFDSGINIKIPKINIPKFLRRLTHKVPVLEQMTDWSIRATGMFMPITWIDKGMREEAFKDWKRWGSRIPQMVVGAATGCAVGAIGGPVGCVVGAVGGGFVAGTTKGSGFKFKLFKSGILPGIQAGGVGSIAGGFAGSTWGAAAEVGAQAGAQAGAQVGTQVASQAGVSLATPIGVAGQTTSVLGQVAVTPGWAAQALSPVASGPGFWSTVGSGAWGVTKTVVGGQLSQMALQTGMQMLAPAPSPLDENIWDTDPWDEEETYVDEGSDTGLPDEPGMQTPIPDPGIAQYQNPYAPYNAYSPMSDPRYWGSYPQYGLEYPVPTVPSYSEYIPASGVPLQTPYGGGWY